ncbi:SNUT2 protein, partial [Phainopepla nitens]|nr:SNUT2 protein [Phainopepla nitens]
PRQPAEEKAQLLQNSEYQERMVESTFLYLTLDLPTAPLYKDEKEQLIIPQLGGVSGGAGELVAPWRGMWIPQGCRGGLGSSWSCCGVPRNVDLREYLSEEVQAAHSHTTYDLVANIVHDGKPSEGSYRIHVLHHGTGKWYELQDLQVTDILPQMITLSEAYIQIWKRREEDDINQQQGA